MSYILKREGRCPIFNRAMRSTKTIYWKDENLNGWRLSFFPYLIYECKYHGAYVWRGDKRGHILANFSLLKRDAKKKEEIKSTDRSYQFCNSYKIIKVQCPYCEETWEQHEDFGRKNTSGELIEYLCPNGHQIPIHERKS